MKRNVKLLKNLLTTASTMAVLVGGVESAAADNTRPNSANANVTLSNVIGNVANAAGFITGDSFHWVNAGKSITTNGATTIGIIDINNVAPADPGFLVVSNTSLGGIINTGGAQLLNTTVADGFVLTLNAAGGKDAADAAVAGALNIYDDLGTVELAGAGGRLAVAPGGGALTFLATTTIDGAGPGQGILVVTPNAANAVTFNGIIGGNNALARIDLNAGTTNFAQAVSATTINIINANTNATVTGLVTATTIKYLGAGTFTANAGIVGNVDFRGVAGTFNVGAGQNITGTVDSTLVGAAGIVNFAGAGNITGQIGATKAITKLTVTAGAVGLTDGVNVAAIQTTKFLGAATLTTAGGITGDIDFNNQAGGTLTVAVGKDITGAIDSAAGGVGGVVNFAGASNVTGRIGANNGITKFNLNAGIVDLQFAANAAVIGTTKFIAAGTTLHSAGGITGNIDFNNTNGIINLDAGKNITGDVDSVAVGAGGVVNFANAGSITGQIGANNGITELNLNGAGIVGLTHAANSAKIATTKFAVGGITLHSAGGITGDIDFNNTNGIINLDATKNITGAIDGDAANGGVGGVVNFAGAGNVTGQIGATKAITKLTVTAGAVGLTHAGNVAAIQTTKFLGAATLTTAGGITGDIDFNNQAGILTVANGKNIIGFIDGDVANAGVGGTVNFVGASNVNGVIGGTKAITAFNLNGAGLVDLLTAGNVAKVALTTFKAAGITLHSAGGITGDIDFNNKNGTLNVAAGKDITGTVDSTGGVNGTLNFLGAGQVTGVIGATKALTAINAKNGAVVFGANVNVGDVTLGDAANVATAALNGALTNVGNLNFAVVGSNATIVAGGGKMLNFTGAAGNYNVHYKDGANTGIIFGDAAAVLQLSSTAGVNGGNTTATLTSHVDNGAPGGIVNLNAALGTVLTIDGGPNQLGNANKLTEINATGAGQVILTVPINTAALNAKVGTLTVTNAAAVAMPIDVAANATYELSIAAANITGAITLDPAGILKLSDATVPAAAAVYTLNGVNVTAGVDKGTVIINANANGVTVSSNAAETLGVAVGNRLAQVDVTGGALATINSGVFAKNINITNTVGAIFNAVETGVDGTVTLNALVPITFGNANGVANIATLNANNQAATITANGKLQTSITNGANATLALGAAGSFAAYGGGAIAAPVSLKAISLVAGGSLASGTYNITDLYSTGVAGPVINLGTAGAAFVLNGGINQTVGSTAGNFNFVNGGTVTGNVGTAVTPAGNITVAAGTNLALDGSVNATDISGAGGISTLTFNGGANTIITSKIGNANPFASVTVKSPSLSLVTGGTFNATTLNITSAGATTLTAKGINFANTAVTNNSTGVVTLVVGAADTTFGKATLKAGDIVQMTTDHTVNITSAGFLASLTTTAANQGTVNLNNVNGGQFATIGANGSAYKQIIFTKTATVGDVYSQNINVLDAQTATFAGGVNSANGITLTGATATALFPQAANVNYAINGAVAGNGVVNFNNGATINSALGANAGLATVNFTGVEAIALNNNITAGVINFPASKVTVGSTPPILTGNTTFNGTHLVLGSNNLGLGNGSATFTGKVLVDTTLGGTIATPVAGQVKINSGTGKVTLAAGNSLTFNITNNLGTAFRGNVTLGEYTSGDMSAFDVKNAKITVNSDNVFDTWTPVIDAKGNIIANVVVDTTPILDKDRATQNVPSGRITDKFIDQLNALSSNPNAGGYEFLQQVGKIEDAANRVDALVRASTSDNVRVTEVLGTVMTDLTGSLENRINSLMSPTIDTKISDAGVVSGMAAGDDPTKYGVWGGGTFGESTQKSTVTVSGYRTKSAGGSIGFDAKITEDALIGAAVSMANTDVKYKDFKSGDKTKLNSASFSIYGMYQFTNEIFAQSVASYASTKVRNKELRRISNTTYETALGKYTAKSFAIEVMTGYNKVLNNQFIATPMVGFDYTRVDGNKYTESGATAQSFKVNTKAYDRFDLVAGAKLASVPVDVNNCVLFTPEVHAFVRQTVSQKTIKVNIRTADASLNTDRTSKPATTFGNIGVGFNGSCGMIEYGAGYDLILAKKFVGNQGSLKVRVNF